ncbi:MAG: Phosphoribosylglycinamide formyltransferase [Caldanaerobacter subterraneus]|jgi:phosphoribosylglycinamide formyltransferase-1|uniref:Phosphoribosylglycinamide formyltransferase n=2 Tax=Thermoanaerobacter TaxID=1754 RepID=B0KBQ2_THEP3|nr:MULTISPECIES: phosphoribosylglycinamide formyltransferase [Thermoanaerobacter]KUJ89856.1 MAG: phosphoribosylglycinamide formyltransferase [Thermoanaerobacter thermocopriae]KUK35149.1 MAG: Phosphoribosylglycinamide formyltransferase [Caldanaerobacter subterraneus]ABY91832.1 phosphoribosylglycinamide formyltransferase [Thermoanaerobacter sp. X514]ABY95347.1 phosphoribosylglycinamide formyltransferase [Thermoanaerobacter pseudethanolicus ATCC 33223]ADV80287.1 phosphoribosylglycinamide formyltr
MNLVVMASGNGTDLQSIIDAIEEGYINARIIAVISDKKGAYALERAKKHGIATYCLPKKELKENFQRELLKLLEKLNPDGIILAGFLTILSGEIVERFENKIINIHPSLIPAFCGKGFYGMKVHQAVYEYGVKYTGCTVHFVDSGADTGPIILQEVVKIDEEDTPEAIAKKVLEVEHKVLPYAVKLFTEGKLKVEGRKVKILKF